MSGWLVITGTTTAWIALLIWPFVSILFFRLMSVPSALTATIVGGYLFLPEQTALNLRALPPLDKATIPAISALLSLAAVGRRPGVETLDGMLPRSPWTLGMIAVMAVGVIGTVLTNREPLDFGPFLPGLRPWDLLSVLLALLITLLPFLMARKYLASAAAQIQAVTTFVVLALIYSLLALYEVRMSPQLNVELYGFFAHAWDQHVRGGGFRPIVFLSHGLWVSIFFAMATLAAFGLFRTVPKEQKAVFLLATIWLYGTLFLSKSLGALLIATALMILSFLPRRAIRIGLAVIVGLVLTYPLMRSVDIVPTKKAVELASIIDPVRASSLNFRFRNEDVLLEHARKKPVFGWGGWGRNRATRLDDGQPAVPDGYWVISMGLGGYLGFLTEFGLLAIGVLAVALGRHPPPMITMTIAVVLAANLVDLIPNATQTTLTWLWAGALAGRLERRGAAARDDDAQPSQAPQRRTAYTRGQVSESPYRRDLGPRHPTR